MACAIISVGGALGERAMMSPAMAVSLLMNSGVNSVPLHHDHVSHPLKDTSVHGEEVCLTDSSLTLPEMKGIRANWPCSSNRCGDSGIKSPSILGAKMNLASVSMSVGEYSDGFGLAAAEDQKEELL